MDPFLKKVWDLIGYDQRKEWDRIAFSFLRKEKKVLDVGCGEGRFIAQDPKKITGVDLNEASLKKCRKKKYRVVKADVRKLPFKNQSFAGVHCSHVIEHFDPGDAHQLLSELDRVLAPGGILVIRTPLLWSRFYADLSHVKPYPPEAILSYLRPSRQRTFKQISIDYQLKYFKWRYQSLDLRLKPLNAFFFILSRWGFPWLKRNGYLMVLKKGPRS